MLASYHKNFIFIGKNEGQNAYFAVVNMDNNESIKIDIPNSQNANIYRFYVKDKNLYYTRTEAKETPIKVDLTEQQREFLFEKQTVTKFDLEMLSLELKNRINLLIVGDDVGMINYSKKLEFFKYLDDLISSNSDQNLKAKYAEINKRFDELLNSIKSTHKKILFNITLPNVVHLSHNQIEKYGYNFEGLEGVIKFTDLVTRNDSMRYDLLFSKTKDGNYQTKISNVERDNLKLKAHSNIEPGFYKIKVYLDGDKANFAETNPLEIKISQQDKIKAINSGLIELGSSRYVNIDSEGKLIKNNLTLEANIAREDWANVSADLYFISYKTGQIKKNKKLS
ncbi:hypothetical protein [Mycoplasma struthionis]|uniref:Uncharacterized protein n=1 Tax=Mycoplasma struthionis TaxID=538220 RepID=A0A502M1P4_9MOLU|nr:hypothetical protein [Mycoplasma struthionis]TPI01537.1 hypothetical protein FJM01_02085 [Mycoplasma struthionis]